VTALAALTGLPLLALLVVAYVGVVLLLARFCALSTDPTDGGAGDSTPGARH
jgi:hypothetical protein